MILRSFQRKGLCNSGLKAKSTTFVRNITTIRLRSQFVILKMNININMTDNKESKMKRFVIIFISLIVNASVFFYRGVMIILLLLILGCSDSNKVAKETNVSIDVINKVGFKSVFAKNGIFVKLVPAEDNSYSLQVSITNYIDTLDYYLNSKTKQQSVPKILFGTDYVFFLTGSSSYRYITLSYLDKRFNKIITHKYTTSRDVSSDIDGAIFFKEGYYYWYDLKKHVLHCMRSNLNMSSFNEAILFSGDSILIKEGCEIKKYRERDFSQKSSLLTPTIIR